MINTNLKYFCENKQCEHWMDKDNGCECYNSKGVKSCHTRLNQILDKPNRKTYCEKCGKHKDYIRRVGCCYPGETIPVKILLKVVNNKTYCQWCAK